MQEVGAAHTAEEWCRGDGALLVCDDNTTDLAHPHTQEVGVARTAEEWCRGDGAPLARGDSRRFPYAVVEIKLQGAGQPAWIRRLVASGMDDLSGFTVISWQTRNNCRFPYAVAEIKLHGAGQPAWIRRLVASGEIWKGFRHQSNLERNWVVQSSSCRAAGQLA